MYGRASVWLHQYDERQQPFFHNKHIFFPSAALPQRKSHSIFFSCVTRNETTYLLAAIMRISINHITSLRWKFNQPKQSSFPPRRDIFHAKFIVDFRLYFIVRRRTVIDGFVFSLKCDTLGGIDQASKPFKKRYLVFGSQFSLGAICRIHKDFIISNSKMFLSSVTEFSDI